MLKAIGILFLLCIQLIAAQYNLFDNRFGSRLPLPPMAPPMPRPMAPPPPPPPPPSYYGLSYNVNPPVNNIPVNNNNPVVNNNDGLIDEFGQCGGLDWEGPKTCRANLICFKRSKYYSQCISSEAVSVATRPSPTVIPAGGKCHGGSIRGPIACVIGTACFIQSENVHGECKTHCPQGWFCTKQTLAEWAPCGGEGYVGLTKCKEGLQCVAHSKWYHECRSECPEGWRC